jgi:hypothetical protein
LLPTARRFCVVGSEYYSLTGIFTIVSGSTTAGSWSFGKTKTVEHWSHSFKRTYEDGVDNRGSAEWRIASPVVQDYLDAL